MVNTLPGAPNGTTVKLFGSLKRKINASGWEIFLDALLEPTGRQLRARAAEMLDHERSSGLR